MDPGSLLVCMAHVKSIPERAAICDERGINLLALELVTERAAAPGEAVRPQPARHAADPRRGRPARRRAAHRRSPDSPPTRSARSSTLPAAIPDRCRCSPHPRRTLAPRATATAIERCVVDRDALAQAAAQIPAAESSRSSALAGAPQDRVPAPDGPRGRALRDRPRAANQRALQRADDLRVTVLGYGNVAFGALDECMRSGVSHVHIRTERTTEHAALRPHLADEDLIINGIDGRDDPRSYVVTNGDLGSVIRPGTVVVDLVGGSASNRGAVEPIVECTTPDDPVLRRRRRLPRVGLGLAAGRVREGVHGALQRADPAHAALRRARPRGLGGRAGWHPRALVAGPLARQRAGR